MRDWEGQEDTTRGATPSKLPALSSQPCRATQLVTASRTTHRQMEVWLTHGRSLYLEAGQDGSTVWQRWLPMGRGPGALCRPHWTSSSLTSSSDTLGCCLSHSPCCPTECLAENRSGVVLSLSRSQLTVCCTSDWHSWWRSTDLSHSVCTLLTVTQEGTSDPYTLILELGPWYVTLWRHIFSYIYL